MTQEILRTMEFVVADPAFAYGGNTFRLGTKWADLQIGEVVKGEFITNTPEGATSESFGLIVSGISVLHLGTAMERFINQNHGVGERFGVSRDYRGKFRYDVGLAVRRAHLHTLLTDLYDPDGLISDEEEGLIELSQVFTVVEFEFDPAAGKEALAQMEALS